MSDQVAAELPVAEAKSMIGDAFSFLETKISNETGKDLTTTSPEIQTQEEQVQRDTETTRKQNEDVEQVESQEAAETPESANESDDASDIPEGDSATPKAKAKWGEVKKKATQLDKILPEFETLKKEVEALRKGEGIPEFQALKEQLAEREKRVTELQAREEETERKAYLLDVKSSKAYEQAVKQPYMQLLDDAEYVAGKNNLDSKKLLDLIHTDDERGLEELITELPERSRKKVWDLVDNFNTINKAKADIEGNAKGAYETYTAQQREQLEKQNKEIIDKRTAEFERIRPGYEALLKDFPDEAKPNFDEIRKNAITFEKLPEHHKVLAAISGSILPQVMDAYKAQAAELAELKKENSSLRNGSPRATTGAAPQASQAKKETVVTSEAGLADDIMKRLQTVR